MVKFVVDYHLVAPVKYEELFDITPPDTEELTYNCEAVDEETAEQQFLAWMRSTSPDAMRNGIIYKVTPAL